MNVYMGIFVVLFVSAHANDCEQGILNCMKTYVESLTKTPMSVEIVCQNARNAIKCIFSQNCPVTAEEEKMFADEFEKGMNAGGFSCPFKVTDVIKEYRNAARSNGPSSLIILAGMSLALMVFTKLFV